MRPLIIALALMLPVVGSAQFVWPKPEYLKSEPGLYKEDPFVIEYRQKFFSVFRGDFTSFERAYAEVQKMVKKNPRDAKAMVWLGNGHTVKAGLLNMKGQKAEAKKLLADSRVALDKAVTLAPKDPNVYMMRAATLYIQGQHFAGFEIPRANWEKLRDDCLKFIDYIGPERMPRTSIHLRGEAYGELGIAYAKLGEREKAIAAFRKVIELNPKTAYSERAEREIAALKAK